MLIEFIRYVSDLFELIYRRKHIGPVWIKLILRCKTAYANK